ncbi:integrase core domain-containing protein [Kitasatospora sp. NPDC048545]|uniref:integrase core domain-containing protein n=1 Tax=Kitasatospora sp. NPDC048545 TaxID=3157208 RepID=UPI0033DE9CD8
MERRALTCRREPLDRTLIWNQRHLLHVLREFEDHYNTHRPHHALHQDTSLTPRPVPIADTGRIARLDVRGRDRLGGTLHEYRHAA